MMSISSRTIPFVVGAGMLFAACEGISDRAAGTVGTPAPEYAAATIAGDTVALADLRGQAVVLNIWATWCPPCREEMPGLEELHQTYADQGLRVVGVSIDGRSATGEIQRFVDDTSLTFTILHDPEERITRAFRTVGVPETILIDREGRVVQRWIGKIDPMADAITGPVRGALGAEGKS
jgi:peroxiredoxin